MILPDSFLINKCS